MWGYNLKQFSTKKVTCLGNFSKIGCDYDETNLFLLSCLFFNLATEVLNCSFYKNQRIEEMGNPNFISQGLDTY